MRDLVCEIYLLIYADRINRKHLARKDPSGAMKTEVTRWKPD
jgi:hypothetical protein